MGLFILWVIFGFVGLLIARHRRRDPAGGFALGCLLGPFGWIIALLMSPGPQIAAPDGRPLRKCPHCAEMILQEAAVCRYCGRDVPPIEEPDRAAGGPCPKCGEDVDTSGRKGMYMECPSCRTLLKIR